jgi:hypothetical protein
MANHKSDLPFGSEFSPSQISLRELLEIVSRHLGNPHALEAEILETYFADHGAAGPDEAARDNNRGKLANNCKLGMIAYGLIDRDARFTGVGDTLFALRKAVVYGWRVEEQAANAQKIAELGRELYKRIAVMGGHADAMGKALQTAVGRYNQFVGSLEAQVLTQARRFEDLKVDHQGKTVAVLEPLDSAVRESILRRQLLMEMLPGTPAAVGLSAVAGKVMVL